MQSSAIWLQDGVAYAFQQTVNPGPSHLVGLVTAGMPWDRKTGLPLDEKTEPALRADTERELKLNASPDRAPLRRQ